MRWCNKYSGFSVLKCRHIQSTALGGISFFGASKRPLLVRRRCTHVGPIAAFSWIQLVVGLVHGSANQFTRDRFIQNLLNYVGCLLHGCHSFGGCGNLPFEIWFGQNCGAGKS